MIGKHGERIVSSFYKEINLSEGFNTKKINTHTWMGFGQFFHFHTICSHIARIIWSIVRKEPADHLSSRFHVQVPIRFTSSSDVVQEQS